MKKEQQLPEKQDAYHDLPERPRGYKTTRSISLRETVLYLAEILRVSLPVSRIGLLRLSEDGKQLDSATWSADGADLSDNFNKLLFLHLDQMREMAAAGQVPEDAQLEQMVLQAGVSEFRFCYPTLVPVFHKDELLGLAFYCKPHENGAWMQEEKKRLKDFSDAMGRAFASRGYEKDPQLSSRAFNAMMDSVATNICIMEVDTDRILFMNESMKRAFGVEAPEGKVCWQVLQKDKKGRCSFCPLHRLQQGGGETAVYIWEHSSSVTDRRYESYDRLMRWVDGSLVHFQQSMDITDSNQLVAAESRDELTGVLNRRAGKEALRAAMVDAKAEEALLTVCMYDINILREVNDAFGYAEGDFLITTAAQTVQDGLTERDFQFRLSGDEFIAAFYDCTAADTAQRMRRIFSNLGETYAKLYKPYDAGFCCGLYTVSPHDTISLSELLIRVDEKMYQEKRRFHHDRIQMLQSDFLPGRPSVQQFSYDKEHLYEALVQSTDDYVFVCNMKTNVFRFPKTLLHEFDLPGEVVPEATPIWGALVHPDDQKSFFRSMDDLVEGLTNLHNVEYRVKNRRGEWVWIRCRGYLERDGNGEPSLFAGIMTKLGKRNRMDHLTGLFNKVEFEKQINLRLQSAGGKPVGMMILDIDDFRHINDLYDRGFGDEVLRAAAQKIQSILPDNVWIYRLDGDEFGMMAIGMGRGAIQRLFSEIQKLFVHHQSFNGQKYYCTFSAGCAIYPKDAQNYFDLFKYASYSLEYAKLSGKNRLHFFSNEILAHKSRALSLVEQLRESVENGFLHFSLHYQPQVDALSGRLAGAEALVRWSCGQFGAVSPGEFIPLLEESGMIIEVGKWIFRRAAETCKKWAAIQPAFTLSINLSYLQVADPGFLDFIRQTLLETGMSGRNLIVELTESCIASEIGFLRQIFTRLQEIGIRVAMDDFGTGYSSLEILKSTPVNIVKIDRTFVRDIQSSSFDATFIRFIVCLCHDVDISVCLEGVETQSQYDKVRPMQLDSIQGFLFGRPVSESDFEKAFLAQDKGIG